MATIALSAAGMALGGSLGGSILGLSMATIGRAAGAAIGRRIDEQIMGSGSEPVEVGRIDRFRVTGAVEGADLQQVYGRVRVAGQVIWATQFLETSATSGGGKGSRPTPKTTTYSYSVSLAIALCEGEIGRIGRMWADGVEVSPEALNMRVYKGTMDQLPDPKIAAVEGADFTPAYRGTAYVVLEDLDLEQFGNRIPQLTFEVIRPAPKAAGDLSQAIRGTALIPGTGEYALATTQVHMSPEFGSQTAVNTNSPLGGSDFTVALDAMQGDLPESRSVMLAVSWFGDDLRCAECAIAPKVTQNQTDAAAMPWRVSGISRSGAAVVAQHDNTPLYQGTPADAAVVEAIVDLRRRGLEPMFIPELLMEQLPGNNLSDPWSGQVGQPPAPWRGRVTTSRAPGIAGTPDQTALAAVEIAQFLGAATPQDFTVSGTTVSYNGPVNGGYRRYILHYAHLCAAAGGVTGFCIGSDLSGLTQIRDDAGGFPFVAALQALAADVRSVLGVGCKISYAADWDEYHGMTPHGTGDKLFHLDPLWADPNVDFIGINGYFPLSDWRESADHADAGAGAIHDLAYLQGNVAGGEGYDWHYPTPEARSAQRRVPITDTAGEPWVWRPKDLLNWWRNPHHARIDGVRQTDPTAWQPQSKPFWFTEMGCPAVDKGANAPHRKLGTAVEPAFPDGSSGGRDDLIQAQYLRAILVHFADETNNPPAAIDGGRMVDLDRMHVWGWDARPHPFWPGNQALWTDGDRYALGPWLNGRASNRSLASVVEEICDRSGVTQYDTSALFGVVRGYLVSDIGTGRAALQPLMLAYGFDAIERDGVLVFRNRSGAADHQLTQAMLALDPETDQALSLSRAAGAEVAGRVQLAFLHADGDYDPIAAATVLPDDVTLGITRNEVPLVLTRNEGQATVTRWLQEARVARDTARFALPPSQLEVGAGDVVDLDTNGHQGRYRIDRIEEAGVRLVDATRVAPAAYQVPASLDESVALQPYVGPIPAEMLFLDLPLLTGDELPHAPYVAAAGQPWPGNIALYGAPQDSDYALHDVLNEAAVVGVTQTALARGPVGIWDRQAAVDITLVDGSLSSATTEALLAGANLMAIGDGGPNQWEVFQFQQTQPLYTRGFGLSGLLRGQAGSRGLMPDLWPAGSRVVLLNGVPEQVTLPTASRGIARHFRYGPAKQPMTDPSYRYISHAFAGNGLRPYPVAHLRARATGSGLDLSWIRCSRIDGDIWADAEIPLGEDIEAYTVRILQGGVLRREEVVSSQGWTYASADMAAEVGGANFDVAVAQMSDRFGAGPFTTLTVSA